jgi:outer membrane protein assembly factor BamB
MNPSKDPSRAGVPRVRWWIAACILLGAVTALACVWGLQQTQRQVRVMETVAVLFFASVLLLVWLLFLSCLQWRTRILSLGALAVMVLLALACFRYVGVTGDLVPIFEPRWRLKPSVSGTGESVLVSSPVLQTSRGESAAGYPQFLGPGRDGVIPRTRIARDWTGTPPTMLWRRPVGAGWGGFAIHGGKALTQEQDGPDELVTCYELTTGRQIWAHRYPARYDNPIGGIGPRATPTVAANRVYTLGGTGILKCLDFDTGREIWGRNSLESVKSPDLEWGISSSPLVFGDRVVVAPRGADFSLLACRMETGEPLWTAGRHQPGYGSPRLERILGVEQILTFTSDTAAAHDPETGRLLWEYPWKLGQRGHPHVTDPRAVGTNCVLISSAYGAGSHLVQITRSSDGAAWFATNVVWQSRRLKSKFANVLFRGGHGYGLDDGRLVCIDLTDGNRRWDGERFGHGQLLLLEDVILVTSEQGAVVLVEAVPDAYVPLTRFTAFERKTWNPPALADDTLLLRNDEEAAAYRLPTLALHP